jgi:heme oxygenase
MLTGLKGFSSSGRDAVGASAERREQPPLTFADLLRARTRHLHARAERSGVVKDILSGQVDEYAYALFLRNLLAVYRELEAGLNRYRRSPSVGGLYAPAVFRSAALESDLGEIVGSRWERDLPLLAAGERYRVRVASAAQGNGVGLIAHAYVRYLGDLNGGQIIAKILIGSLGLPPAALCFYRFAQVEDLPSFKLRYRRAIDRAGLDSGERAAVLEEALAAFQLNIDLSEEVKDRRTTGSPL